MLTGPVGPVEVFFYWPEDVFKNFYWPGAIGSPLASSPEYHLYCRHVSMWSGLDCPSGSQTSEIVLQLQGDLIIML